MKVLTPGHRYEVDNFEDPKSQGNPNQIIQFIEKEKNPSGALATVCDGTTNEELLRVLIDRLQFLSQKLPSRESAIALNYIQQALAWLKKRTEDRRARGVEGTFQK